MDISNLPPIPNGFKLKDSGSSTATASKLPPIPDGFKLQGGDSQGESGDDWMSKSFPKTARNNLSKLYQGGANSPALKKAQYDVEAAKSRDNPINNTLKGLADAGKQTTNPFNSIVKSASGGDSGKSASDMAVDFINKIDPAKGVYKEQDKSVARLAGDVIDMATTPANIIGGKIIEAGVKNVLPQVVKSASGTFNKAKEFATDLIAGPDKARAAAEAEKFALGQKTAQQIETTQKVGKMKLDIAKKNANAVSQGYDNLTDNLKKQVVRYSDKQGQDLQKELPKIFGQKSAEYGKAQESIIKSLPENRKNIPAGKIVNDMESTLRKFRILKEDGSISDAELTPSEQKILGIYRDLKQSLEPTTKESGILDESGKPITETTPGKGTIHVDDLIKNQKYIEPDYGKPFDPDDKLKAEIAKGFSKNVTDAVPELQKLRTRYAPFLEWKESAIKNMKPFNSQYDVATGTVAKQGTGELDPSGERLMAKLEKLYQTPYGTRINALNKGIKATALNKEESAQAAKEGIQKLRNSIAQDIKELRKGRTLRAREIDLKTDQLVRKYNNKRLLFGILGTGGLGIGDKLLQYFVRKQAYTGLTGSGG